MAILTALLVVVLIGWLDRWVLSGDPCPSCGRRDGFHERIECARFI